MKEVEIISKVVGRTGTGAVGVPSVGGIPSVDLSGYLLKKVWDEAFELKETTDGTPYLYGKLPVVVQYGITMYGEGGNVNIPSIYAGLPIDGTTIYWDGGVLKAQGGGSGGAITDITSSMVVSALGYTPANASDLTTLQSTVNDFLSGSDTDTIINKWKELEVFLSGLSESDNLATILGNKADNATTLAGYGITDAYTKSDVNTLLGNYVTLATAQTITGKKDFTTGGLFVNGKQIQYIPIDGDSGYWKLEGDLLVTGGITMFANEGTYTPTTIMDGLVLDSATLGINDEGQLYVKGGTGSGSIEGLATVATTGKYSDLIGVPTLLSSFTDDVVAGKYLPLSGGTLTSESVILCLNRLSDENPATIQYQTNGKTVGYLGFDNEGNLIVSPRGNHNNVDYFYVWHSGGVETILPIQDITYDVGSLSAAFNNVYSKNIISNTTLYINSNSGSSIIFQQDGIEVGRFKNITGDLLVGTQTDSAKLSVGGTIYASGDVSFGNTLSTVGAINGGSTIYSHGKKNTEDTVNGWVIARTYLGWCDGVAAGLVQRINVSSEYIAFSGKTWHTSTAYFGNSTGYYFSALGNMMANMVNAKSAITLEGTTPETAILKFSREGFNYITFPSSGTLALGVDALAASSLIVLSGTNKRIGIGSSAPVYDIHIDSKQMFMEYTSGYPIVMKRKTSGGVYTMFMSNNQEAIRWMVGSDANHKLVFNYSNDTGASVNNKATLDNSGNLLVYGGITMYSDIRKKTKLLDVELTLSQIANAPLIEHYYNSDDKRTTHVGSIAQYWAGLNDWFCKKDQDGFYTMEIQNAALASAISVARHLQKYESKTDRTIRKLKKRICELEDEMEKLKSK